MYWRNEEHYPDFTAGEAISRVMHPEDHTLPDDESCRRLIEAVARQAVEDHISALRRLPNPSAVRRAEETAAFLRSDYFRRLTGLNGSVILRMVRKELGLK